ncbi:CHAT domain-containing protein [Winogradskyella sp. 3972H.M.0a.05]|uniref:CHAT domain-containing protein n=1 Tax=Winogradskyella sp. 3972H.M.0a.05 TaxID=2950277 RepID=UPI003399F890
MITPSCYYRVFLLLIFLFSSSISLAQVSTPSLLELVDNYLEEKQLSKADSLINSSLTDFTSSNQIDSLYQFPLLIGKLESYKTNATKAGEKAELFVTELKQKTSNARTIFKAYLSLDQLYLFLGDDTKCVAASKKALSYAKMQEDVTYEELGKINYVIGGNYYALYDLSNAVSYFKNSVAAYEKSETVKKHVLADSYNGVAVSMWTLNKLDSAQVYFNKAIAATEISDLTNYDRLYYITAFKFNLALVIDSQGRISEAIEIKEEIIKRLQEIINGSKDDFLVTKSRRLQSSAISNLAAFYNDTGYLTKAYEMLKYAYEKKKDVYESTSPRLATALNQIAYSEIQLQEFDNSIETSNKALKNLRASNSKYLPVEAEILHTLAKAYLSKQNITEASRFFKESETLFNKAYPVEYSREYLVLLRDYALFLANHGDKAEGVAVAQKTYDYVLKNGGETNLSLLKETINLADVYYESGNYQKSSEWALEGIQSLDERLESADSNMNAAQIEYYKPQLLLLECKSKYQLESTKDEKLLVSLLDKLDQATELLERRKTTVFKTQDINSLLLDYKSITDFSKQIALELYKSTKNSKYLDKIIELHESGIYHRIRSRLNLKDNIAFVGIPKSVLAREQALRTKLSSSLNTSESISSYFEDSNSWTRFVDSLKQNYPKYYDMRYATIEESLTDLQENIDDTSTVVRYLFVESNLYAFIVTKNDKKLYKLDYDAVKHLSKYFTGNPTDISEASSYYHALYETLWAPFKDDIQTNHVTIVPDGELFNLSFETLTTEPIKAFSDLANLSLLANHIISYNYSLLLLKPSSKTFEYRDDFIAFAPEFNDQMKNDYKIAIKDSLEVDRTYLNLIPQPFSVDIAEEFSRLFNGDSYLNENATKQLFNTTANEHKIIHIGTHAESNNVSPELSRLVFAKAVDSVSNINENYLYTYEIYNENINSDLAILTACETGKPTYQAGEGMISLAHAFNYAGSESILTSLWKIDEQSSNEIIKHFYNHIANGLSKDEALRQAKLDYIANAQGRTITPQYWAGLVLIGDTSPININTHSNMIWWLLGATIILILIVIGFRIKSKA